MKTFLFKHRWLVLINLFSLVIILGSMWLLVRSETDFPVSASVDEIANAHEQGLVWMANNFDGELFRYEYNPESDRTPKSSNALRQLMGSRVAASEAETSDAFKQIHVKNIEYIFSEWYEEDETGGYVLYKDKSKLGANAMLLRSLVYSPDYDKYENEASMIAKGIMSLQNEDGSFEPWYVEPSYEYDANYLMNFYSGEAILALTEYYEKSGDMTALEAALEAADFYVTEYSDNITANYHPAYVPWHTMSYHKLYSITGNERYLEAVFTMNDRLIQLLDKTVVPGRFYKSELEHEGQNAPHSSSDAVYLEGLLYAYELAKETGEGWRARAYLEAIELSSTRLVRLQYQTVEPNFETDPITYLGGIPVREDNPKIRVDTVQHTLDAFEKYLAVFGESD